MFNLYLSINPPLFTVVLSSQTVSGQEWRKTVRYFGPAQKGISYIKISNNLGTKDGNSNKWIDFAIYRQKNKTKEKSMGHRFLRK